MWYLYVTNTNDNVTSKSGSEKKIQVSIWQIFRYKNYIVVFLFGVFFFFNSMAKPQQNPHCIHPLGEVTGFATLEKDWLCRAAVFTSARSRTLQVKTLLFSSSWCPLAACSMWSVVPVLSPLILANRVNPSLALDCPCCCPTWGVGFGTPAEQDIPFD